jgi:hypothetical protein
MEERSSYQSSNVTGFPVDCVDISLLVTGGLSGVLSLAALFQFLRFIVYERRTGKSLASRKFFHGLIFFTALGVSTMTILQPWAQYRPSFPISVTKSVDRRSWWYGGLSQTRSSYWPTSSFFSSGKSNT